MKREKAYFEQALENIGESLGLMGYLYHSKNNGRVSFFFVFALPFSISRDHIL